MKQYPSISTNVLIDKEYFIFDKLDGSNIRAEWTNKRGFHKFGSRTQLLSTEQEVLYPAKDKILEKYSEELEYRFKEERLQKVTCFFEYFGPNSFAGLHKDDVNDMNVVLLDIFLYKKGFMKPKDFIDFSRGLEIPKVLGKEFLKSYDERNELVNDIYHAKYNEITFEGVVFKSSETHKNTNNIYMAKVKTLDWLDKLKSFCGSDVNLYNRLS